jgi:hypothetical protein
MSLIALTEEARTNPVDVVEHVATLNQWPFNRTSEDEITISICRPADRSGILMCAQAMAWSCSGMRWFWLAGWPPLESSAVLCFMPASRPCGRYYGAFQFVVWAGKPAHEAMSVAMFDTQGEA